MKANELRIGNFVSKDGAIYEADFITIRMSENYEPIPLTEEWLCKFGFEKIPDPERNYRNIPIKSWLYVKNDFVFNSFIGMGDQIKHWFIFRHRDPASYNNTVMLYVHQLQNLYFALTGEELTIKL